VDVRLWRILKREPINLVITDLVMPDGRSGLMRVLRKETPNLPIITLSGVQDVMEYRRIAARLGVKVALLKPVLRAYLIGAVTDVFGRNSPRRYSQGGTRRQRVTRWTKGKRGKE
jgi:YesN/AraC family two-component response regulator